MVERLMKYLKSEGIKITEFERQIGLSRGHAYKLNDISPDILSKISNVYPNLNMKWLQTGKGKMYDALSDRIVDRMEEYIVSKGQNVDYVGKEVWGRTFFEEILLGKKPKDTFFKYYREHPNEDANFRAVNHFIKNYAYDVNPTWLFTGTGEMFKTEEKCKNCEELLQQIGVLKYQLAQQKKKK